MRGSYPIEPAVATAAGTGYSAGMLVATLLGLSFSLPQAPTAAAPAPTPAPLTAWVIGGANNHDWEWTNPEIGRVLAESGRFAVRLLDDPVPTLREAPRAHRDGQLDVLVLNYHGPRWGGDAEAAFLAAVQAGCGVAVIHAANNAFEGWQEYERMVGLLWRQGTGHGQYHPFDVRVVDHHHPLTVGMADLVQHPDELYHRLVPAPGADHRVLLSAFSDPKTGGTGRMEPMVLVSQFGKGRVFHTPLGHVWRGVPQSRATWYSPQLRRLVARGTEWAASGVVTLDPRPLNFLAADEAAAGFELLFDGRSLRGWRAFRSEAPPSQGWVIRDAAIVHEAGGGGGDLVTDGEYADFDFRFAFRVAPKANSGVIWHVLDSHEQTYITGPEYQVLDDVGAQPGAKHSVGALYDLVAPADKEVRPAGQWNDGRIVVQQGKVQHWLNGKLLLEVPCAGPDWQRMVQASKFRDWPFGQSGKGRIALQDHGDEVAFRNLRIKRL